MARAGDGVSGQWFWVIGSQLELQSANKRENAPAEALCEGTAPLWTHSHALVWHPPCLQGDILPHHGFHHRLQEKLCSGAWSSSNSSFCTGLRVCRAFPLTCSLLTAAVGHCLQPLSEALSLMVSAWPDCPAALWHWLCPKWAAPGDGVLTESTPVAPPLQVPAGFGSS